VRYAGHTSGVLEFLYRIAYFSSLLKILRVCAKFQVIELVLIMTLVCGVLDVEENLLCVNLTIAYKCFPRNNCIPHSPQSLTLDGNECFPYSPHSSALEGNEPILMMHV
jgi:hypothetical protein